MGQARLLGRMAASNWKPVAALQLLAVVYVAGFWLPAPWIGQAVQTETYYQTLAGIITLFAVGPSSWMIAIALVELLLIASRRLRRSRLAATGHADPFGRVTIVLCLMISTIFAINTIIQAVSWLPPGKPIETWSLTATALSMTGGTAIIIVLARLAEHHLPGLGPWFLFAAGDISVLFEKFGALLGHYGAGAVSGSAVLLRFTATLAVLSLCCWLVGMLRKTANAGLLSPVYALFMAVTMGGSIASQFLNVSTMTNDWMLFVWVHRPLILTVTQVMLLAIMATIYGIRQMTATTVLLMAAALVLGLVIDKWGGSLIEITTAMILAIIVQPVVSAIVSQRSLPRIGPTRNRG